jgi:hypothetical protein
MTATAREAIEFVAQGLGGAERFLTWAQKSAENEDHFWCSIYPKLLPLQLTGANEGPLKIESITRTIVEPLMVPDLTEPITADPNKRWAN